MIILRFFKNHIKNLLALSLILMFSVNLNAQNLQAVTTAPQNKIVKWMLLNGEGNDFFFAMPEGSSLFIDSNFRLNDVYDARVNSFKRITRSINGVFLSVTLYQGAAKDISKILLKEEYQKVKALKDGQNGASIFSVVKDKYSYQEKIRQGGDVRSGIILSTALYENPESAKKETVKSVSFDASQAIVFEQKNAVNDDRNGFECNFFTVKSPEYVGAKQYYLFQNNIYVVEALARAESNSIYRSFLESIRLVKNNAVVSPNLSKPAEDFAQAKLKLPPPILERNFDEAYLGQLNPVEELNKQPKINFVPTPVATKTNSIFDNVSEQIRIVFRYKLRLTLLANGKVGDVKVLTKNLQKSAPISDETARKFEENIVKAFKSANFIPAEKDGKAVSTEKVIEYQLEIQ